MPLLFPRLRPLFQNGGVITDQRISYGGSFASEPLLQPRAEAVPEIPRALFEKSLRQIDSAVLQFHLACLDHRDQLPRLSWGRLRTIAAQPFAEEIQIMRSSEDLGYGIEIIDQRANDQRIDWSQNPELIK